MNQRQSTLSTLSFTRFLVEAIKRSNVDFPEPDGPSSAKNSPGVIVRLIFFNTSVVPYDRLTSRHSTLTFFMMN